MGRKKRNKRFLTLPGSETFWSRPCCQRTSKVNSRFLRGPGMSRVVRFHHSQESSLWTVSNPVLVFSMENRCEWQNRSLFRIVVSIWHHRNGFAIQSKIISFSVGEFNGAPTVACDHVTCDFRIKSSLSRCHRVLTSRDADTSHRETKSELFRTRHTFTKRSSGRIANSGCQAIIDVAERGQ